MSVIKKMRKQHAVWWQRVSAPDVFGRYSYLPPVEVECRWDDAIEEVVNVKGEKVLSQSVVYVDRIMAPGDYLSRGTLDSDTPDDPTEASGASEIQRFDQNPNFKATETLLTAYL